MVKVPVVPLTLDGYVRYGDVVMAAPRGEPGAPANQGTARRFDHLARLEDLRPGAARLNVSVFRCAPRVERPIAIALLERHAKSTQMFIPMTAKRFLVVVALGSERPDLSTLAAFLAVAGQGITYHPGVWHHPMIALDAESDFACFSHEAGTKDDCDVYDLAPDERAVIEVS